MDAHVTTEVNESELTLFHLYCFFWFVLTAKVNPVAQLCVGLCRCWAVGLGTLECRSSGAAKYPGSQSKAAIMF